MGSLRKFIAYTTASVGLASLAAWVAIVAMGQGTPAGNNDVTVCVGPDSVLRLPQAGICPAGNQKLSLPGPSVQTADAISDSDPLGPSKSAQESDLDGRLAALEKRIGNLENRALFEVVNKKDDVIFSVRPEQIHLYNKNKALVAAIVGTPEGGQISAGSADGNLSAFLGTYGGHAGLRLKEKGTARLDLLKQEAGNYSLRIPNGDGVIAGLGESRAGSGALVIGDGLGRPKASMTLENANGSFSVFNDSGAAIGMLSRSASGSGLLVLTDANSYAVVKMGTSPDSRYGVVMTMPPGFPYVPKSGLPGSYMLGCAANPGGLVCVP
jgi:hypothetical protein